MTVDAGVDASARDAELGKLLGLGQSDEPDEGEEGGTDGFVEDGDTEDQESEEELAFEDLPKSWQDKIKELRTESGNRRSRVRELTKEVRDLRAGKTQTPEAEIEAAKQAGRDEVREQYGTKLAGAEVKAALKGVIAEDRIDKVVGTLNLSRFVDEDGEVDIEAITDLRDEYVSLLGTRKTATAKVSHGRQGNGNPAKKSTAQMFGEALNL